MSKEIKVSIVVPVYNVEKYIERCLQSLVQQTYKSYEVILVDDGSTDTSGLICDRYAKQYLNISVFHKKNGGLSSARNYALHYIKGEYTTFVDSDDFLENTYLSEMVQAIVDIETDMIISTYWEEFPDGKKEKGKVYPEETFTASQALGEMCYEEKFGTSACVKLIASNIVKQFPFPEGKLYEDLATVYRMIACSRKIVFIGKPLYHYIQRPGSIMDSRWKENTLDVMEAADALLSFVEKNFPDVSSAAIYRYFFSAQEIYKKSYMQKNYTKIIENTQIHLKEYWPILKKDSHVSLYQKVKMYLMAFHPQIYKVSRIIVKKL